MWSCDLYTQFFIFEKHYAKISFSFACSGEFPEY